MATAQGQRWEYKALTFMRDATGAWVSVSEDGQICWPWSIGYQLGALARHGWQVVHPLSGAHLRDDAQRLTLVVRRQVSLEHMPPAAEDGAGARAIACAEPASQDGSPLVASGGT